MSDTATTGPQGESAPARPARVRLRKPWTGLTFLRHPAEGFDHLAGREPTRLDALQAMLGVSLFFAVHTSLLYSRIVTLPHLLPPLAFWMGLLSLHGGVFQGALRLGGGKATGRQALARVPLTYLPLIVYLLASYPLLYLLTPDLYYTWFFYEDLRYIPGVPILISIALGGSWLTYRLAEKTFRAPRRASILAAVLTGVLFVGLGLLLYLFTSGDLLQVVMQ
ncbi:MAG: hypothetical protein HY558_08155 [Euryarchaeota archaeon]|nr:hypothetical protein [Euryarchaeota archaeon]